MKKNSFVEGTIIATFAIVFVKLLGMLYVIPFYATIGATGAALYAYAYNIYLIFLDISSAGIPIAMSKIINEYNTLGMIDAKTRAFSIGKKIVSFISIASFIVLFLFANTIATGLIGGANVENTVSQVAFVIRCISFAVLIIPYLSVAKGYLQGHNFIKPASISQVLEQVVRIIVIFLGSYLALKVFKLSLTTAVGMAVFGAFFGGLTALIYVRRKISTNKENLNLDKEYKKDKVTNKEISKKIIAYAVPFIIINTVVSIYNFVDMALILRTLDYLKFNGKDVEFITTAVTTWGPKINMIISALASGMSVSLIPSIVTEFTLKNWKGVNEKLNRALQIILVISLPMAIGISLLSKPIWSIFYGYNATGSMVLAIVIFVAVFLNLYMITSSTLQSLNKFKIVYISTVIGFVLNAVLNIPLMLLFHKIGLPTYYGAVVATFMGYTASISIALIKLKKEHDINYSSTIRIVGKIIVPLVAMIVVVWLGMEYIPLNVYSRISCLIYSGILSILGGATYLIITYKMGVLNDVFGAVYIKKIMKKLTFGKISI